MGTIVTVHGTFAQGPDTGCKWWQKTSDFEAQLRGLVEATDGQLEFVPHGWTGLNSESARRRAGSDLFKRLQGFEAEERPYCVIGHSHGGSVIVHALAEGSHQKRDLPRLSRWITVGTPFIAYRNIKTVLSRFGVVGKAAYVLAMTIAVLSAVSSLSDPQSFMNYLGRAHWLGYLALPVLSVFMVDRLFAAVALAIQSSFRRNVLIVTRRNRIWPTLGPSGSMFYFLTLAVGMWACFTILGWEDEPEQSRYTAIATVVGLLLVFDLTLRFFARRSFNRKASALEKLFSGFASKWTALTHRHDEAINGLRQLPNIRSRIFAPQFCVNSLTTLGALLLPVIVLFVYESSAIMSLISAKSGLPVTTNTERFTALVQGPALMFDKSLDFSKMSFTASNILMFIPLALACIAYVLLAKMIAIAISWCLSIVLNCLAWNQIRGSTYGSDVIGETWLAAAHVPTSTLFRSTLPKTLACEITNMANSRALSSINRVRSSLGAMVFREEETDQQSVLKKYLAGDELIHTSYFAVERFNKLVAFAISQSPGFKPSARFINDPDYSLVASWFEQLEQSQGAPMEARSSEALVTASA
jgi:hypothetical protein